MDTFQLENLQYAIQVLHGVEVFIEYVLTAFCFLHSSEKEANSPYSVIL